MLITSAQGGPLILPELKMEEEGFVVKNAEGKVIRESASVLHKTSRTIIGTKGTDECHIFIITDENPMDLYEVQELCKSFNLDRAMAFDGGSSTSMNYKKSIEVVSLKGDGAGRMLKSFMLVY
jgi:exopolysaccharide biosynthesis protein